MAFDEKSIFIWNDYDIGTPAVIVAKLLEAGFEGAILHSVYLSTWATSTRVELARQLRAAGMRVYGSSGVYGATPSTEGERAGQLVNTYNLDGWVFDAEKTWDEQPTPDSNAVHLLTTYKATTGKPCAWCWWPFYKSHNTGAEWHPVKVLKTAMQYADYGMPMAYWWLGDDAASATAFLDKVWSQWRAITDKPIIPAGRAYTGDNGTARPEAVTAYEARARSLGAAGITWWSMEHALKLPDAWAALSATPKWLTIEEPEEPPVADNPYKSFAMGQYVSHENQLTNPAMKFVIADAGNYITGPNPRLAPIEAKAAEMGAHYFILWDLDITWYEDGQYTPTPNMTEYWPKPESDIPLIQFKDAIKNRSPKLVFVRIMDIAMSNGKPHDPDYLNSAVREFCNRASDWLWKTKKTMLVVQSSYDAYIQPYAPHIYDWCGYWDICIEQATKKASDLDESYPKAEDKPRYHIGEYEPGKSRWRFWFYFDGASTDLYLFNGPPAALAAFLGEEAPDPIDATPPAKPTGLAAVVNEDRSVTLSWQATQDDVGVAEHLIIRDGYQIGVSAGIVYAYTDTPPVGEHSYQVRARDAGGNLSPLSDPVTVSIPADNPETPVDLSRVMAALTLMGADLAYIKAAVDAQGAVLDAHGLNISDIRGHFKP